MLGTWGNLLLNKESEETPFDKVRFMEGPDGGELCSYLGEQHLREWNSKGQGHEVGMFGNEHGTEIKVS